jgi:carbon-monoxide dehydrogenase large subunit/6-hydroxypseudooxynicotine dehydrogenase subunit gamma
VTLRVEDARLLSGRGRFVDDVDLRDQLWARVVRSQFAHAILGGVDTADAAAADGVRAVLTAADLPDVVLPVRTRVIQESLEAYQQAPLARNRVRYVGEPIAVVVAEDPYAAEDAAELVGVAYDELEPVLDARVASRPDAPALFEGRGNVAAVLEMGYGEVEDAFARASHVTRAELSVGRHSGVPLETRGLLAARRDGRLEIWGTTKVPHFNRRVLASLLQVPEASIRLHGADAGGGFGVRGEFYPEDFLIPFLASVTGRPVKWIEDRSEHLVATNHSRHQVHRIEAAFDADHRLLALVDELWHDNGAYIRTHGVIVPDLTLSMLPGPYRVPAYRGTAHVALTNRTPCGTYRGPGRYEGTFVRERLLDIAAHELGLDPIELRRRNLLTPDELPLHRGLSAIGTEMTIDAGDVPGLLERTMAEAGFDAWRRESERLRSGGRSVGVGASVFMEKSGLGPHEHGGVDLLASGSIRVTAGSTSLGQGVETVLATIAAERLGVESHDVDVVLGDTDLVPDGVGSWASRSTVVAGSAVAAAAERVASIAREAAADALEVDPADLRLAGGGFEAAGSPERRITFAELASRMPDGLGARETFAVDHMTYPYGVHLAQVEVDPDSGGVRVLRYFIGYEIGRAIRRELVEGQLVGGAAQGIAGALLEEFRYDEAGQPLATTMADYLVPTAAEVPPIGVLVCEDWPARSNPLGVRGAGEGGATGCGAAIAAAVDDAIGRPGWVRSLPVAVDRVEERP